VPDLLLSVDELEARLGYDVDPQHADALLQDASALARQIADDDLEDPPAAVKPAVASMVHRALVNPLGHESEQVGNYRYSGAKTEGIFATSDEAKTIRRAVGKAGVGTVQMEGYLLPETGRFKDEFWFKDQL